MKETKEKFAMLAKEVLAKAKKIEDDQVQEQQLDMTAMWEDVLERASVKKQQKQQKRWLASISIVTVAASFMLLIWQIEFTKDSTVSTNYLSMLDSVDVIDYTNTSLVTSNKIMELVDNASVSYTETGEAVTDSKIREKKLLEEGTDIGLNTLITPKGKQANLTLPDGTKVKLNSGSKIIYSKLFDKSIREVAVEGEVFFDVVTDEKRPFIVRTKQSDLKVLGTSFCVRSYSDEESSHIVLLEGSVAVKASNGTTTRLAVNQMAYINNKKMEVKNVNPEEYISWMKQIMIIKKGETVKQIASRLEKYYGVSIMLDNEVGRRPISGKISLEGDADLVLSNISKLWGTKAVKTEGKYYLTNRNK